MIEVWKPLFYKNIDLSEKYLISSEGRIYSKKTNKVIKQMFNKSTGYMNVCISNGGRDKKMIIKTHIAVAYNFVDGYKEGLVVNHIDANKKNNRYENLEWITQFENVCHAKHKGLFCGSGWKKIMQFDKNMNFVKEYASISEASRENNICRNSIYNSATDRAKTGGGYIWRYAK